MKFMQVASIIHEKLANEATIVETQDEWIGLADAQQLDLPVGCSVNRTSCRRDESRIFIHCVGYTLAGRIYKYKFHSPETSHANGYIGPKDKKKTFGKVVHLAGICC